MENEEEYYRKVHTDEIMAIPNDNLILELPTSFGKSKIAIELMKKWQCHKILIIVPKLLMIPNWEDELKKWDFNESVTIITDKSIHKYAGSWDVVVFDEIQHYTERCSMILEGYDYKHFIGLSGTVPKEVKLRLKDDFSTAYFYKVTARKAIQESILPDPKVFLIALMLNDTVPSQEIILNPKKGNPIVMSYKDKWKVLKNQAYKRLNSKIIIKCTQSEYYRDLSDKVTYCKNQYMRCKQEFRKNLWLRKSGERLKWLSSIKNDVILKVLDICKDYRTLTFCSSIPQTEALGRYCINSKNENSKDILEAFNNGSINHITACNILNEGMNLYNCQIGIYANVSSSEVIVKQRLGRLLRHKHPIIILPYYIGTRDEEIVRNKMIKDYNPELIDTCGIDEFEFKLRDYLNSMNSNNQ